MSAQDTSAPVERIQWSSAPDEDPQLAAPDGDAAHVDAPADEPPPAPVEVAPAADDGEHVAAPDGAEGESKAEEGPKPAAAPGDELMRKLEVLGQRSAQLRAEREAARRERAEYQAKLTELQQFNENLQRLKGNPIEAAKFLGLDPRELLRATLGEEAPQKTREELIQDELEQLKAWRDQRERAEQEAASRREAEAKDRETQDALARVRATAEEGIRAADDKYELINARGAYQDVVDVQLAYYRRHGVAIPWTVAADNVEQSLEDEAQTYLKTRKLSSRLGAATQPAPTQSSAVPTVSPQAIPGAKTITMRPVARTEAPERMPLTTMSYQDRDQSIDFLASQLAAARRAGR